MFPARAFVFALVFTALPSFAPEVHARPRVRPDQVWESEPELVGYRVSVEPVIRYYRCGRGERCPGGDMVATDAVIWKLRTVLRGPRGEEIEARFTERGRDNYIKDREVRADRWWQNGDVPAATRVLRDPVIALSAFVEWSRSNDPRRLDRNLADGPVRPDLPDRPDRPDPIDPGYPVNPGHPGHPGHPVQPGQPGYPGQGGHGGSHDRYGRCERLVLDKGYLPALLDQCDGVVETCAVTLLDKGYHPNQLSTCRGVEPVCASLLLEKGYHPNQLSSCRFDLSPGCVRELLQRGHHPNQLAQCERVDDRCAIDVLARGHHPNQLSGCRR